MHAEIVSAIAEVKTQFANRLQAAEAAINDLSQKSDRMHIKVGKTSLGDLAVKEFNANKDIFEKSKNVRLELKAATDPVTTGDARIVQTGEMGMAGSAAPLGLQNALVSRQAIGVSALEYSRYKGIEGAAGVQAAEGDAKSPVRPDWELVSETAKTIAGYTVLSRQAVADQIMLRNAVNVSLARSIADKLDYVLWNGVAGGFAGYKTLATTHQSATFTILPDAISESVALMQVAGYAPDCVALHPTTWTDILTARGTSNDQYFSGNYLGVQEMSLRGLRVVISASVPVGEALLLDSTQSELLIVQYPSLELGYSGDQFTRNLITALLETRVIPVFKASGSAIIVKTK